MSADLTGQLLGHYLVQEVIGRGGMSVVYRGIDQRLQRSVALKVMSEQLSADPEFRTRFLEEARAASAIDHVNVVPLYDFGETAGALFIAMRLVDGTDLARELATGPMPVRRALALLGQVGAALDMLHDRGLVHLDVKPANVLITRNESVGTEHVYLADFGLTRRGAGGHRTAGGDFLGSPSYASPEHLRGASIGPASDEYSMTCLLFAALAGRPPYVGDVRTVVIGHLSGVVPSLSALADVPPAVDRVIARGLAGDPALRYPSISDLLTAVRRGIADVDDGPVLDARGSAPSMQRSPGPDAMVSRRSPEGGSAVPRSAPTVGSAVPRPAPTAGGAVPGRAVPYGAPAGSGAVPDRSSTADRAVPYGNPAASEAVPHRAPAAGRPVPRRPPESDLIPGRPVPAGGWQPAPPSFVAPGPPPLRSPSYQQLQPSPHPPGRLQVRPAQFAGPGQHRPAAHRVQPVRSRWPWLLGAVLVLVAVIAVVLVVVSTRSADSGSLRPVGPPLPAVAVVRSPATASPR